MKKITKRMPGGIPLLINRQGGCRQVLNPGSDSSFYVILLVALFCLGVSCSHEKRTKIDERKISNVEPGDTATDKTVNIGVAAMLSPQYALPAYGEIVSYLGQKLGIPAKMLFTQDYSSMNEMVKCHKVIAAFVCSGPYVNGHDQWGMELIAAPVLYGSSSYFSYIIVNKTSNFNSLKDLKGKKFAFTDPQSNTGKMVPAYELALMQYTPETFFSDYIYTGSHDKSVEAVAEGLVDGAAVDNLIWEYLNRKTPRYTSKTKVISKLGPFCMPPFVTYPGCDTVIKERLKEALINMDKDTAGKRILGELFIDRFVPVDDDCYKSIREMNKWLNTLSNKQN